VTVWYFSILWGLMLLGVALFTGCCLVFNPVLKSVRVMGIATAYAIAGWMALTLEWRVALATWCLFAAFGGLVALAYELWARWRYRGTGRRPRPLILLQGFILWPTMVPEAVEGVLIDAGVLEPSWNASACPEDLQQRG
jgi:hypothetical protein